MKAIGKDIQDLDAIFVTHEHNDHIGGVGVLSRRCRLPVYANQGTFRGGDGRLKELFKRCEFATGDTIEFQDFEIRSFRISHDTSDPVGYVIGNGQSRLGYCTDTGKVSHLMQQRLRNCNGLILEFNHDAAAFLRELLHERLEHVVLAHLSETNNLPDLAMNEARRIVPLESISRMIIARQDIPTGLLSL